MWIGGMAGSGKTTLANKIATCFDLVAFHADDWFNHTDISEAIQPYMWKVQKNGWDFILTGKPKNDANCLIQHAIEVSELVISDIAKQDESKRVLIEGVCLFPNMLYNHGITNAIYINQTIEMYESSLKRNAIFMENVVQKANNPKAKYNAVIETYEIIASYINKQIIEHGFPVIQIEKESDRNKIIHIASALFDLKAKS